MTVDTVLGQIAEHGMIPGQQGSSEKTENLDKIFAHDVGADQKPE